MVFVYYFCIYRGKDLILIPLDSIYIHLLLISNWLWLHQWSLSSILADLEFLLPIWIIRHMNFVKILIYIHDHLRYVIHDNLELNNSLLPSLVRSEKSLQCLGMRFQVVDLEWHFAHFKLFLIELIIVPILSESFLLLHLLFYALNFELCLCFTSGKY